MILHFYTEIKMNDTASSGSLAALAQHISKFTTTKGKRALDQVKLKGKGYGFYYSEVSKSLTRIYRSSEMYLLPFEKDDKGRVSIYVPIGYFGAEVILVSEDEIEFIGFN